MSTLRGSHKLGKYFVSFDCQRSKSPGMLKNLSNKIIQDVRRENIVKALTKEPKKSRKLIFREWFNDKVQEFCRVTSLHGYGKFLVTFFCNNPILINLITSSHNSKGLSSR